MIFFRVGCFSWYLDSCGDYEKGGHVNPDHTLENSSLLTLGRQGRQISTLHKHDFPTRR